jgi:hypothetical protein
MNTNNALLSLPNEVLCHAFTFSETEEIFSSISPTCKKINEITKDPIFFKILIKRDFPSFNDKLIKMIFKDTPKKINNIYKRRWEYGITVQRHFYPLTSGKKFSNKLKT